MPTYQYACTSCGEQLEVVQKFTDDALTVCPSCQGRLRKVFSAVGVVFKGSGFYKTDSRSTSTSSAGAKPAATEAKPDGAKTDSGSSTGSGDSAAGSAPASAAPSGGAPSAGSAERVA